MTIIALSPIQWYRGKKGWYGRDPVTDTVHSCENEATCVRVEEARRKTVLPQVALDREFSCKLRGILIRAAATAGGNADLAKDIAEMLETLKDC